MKEQLGEFVQSGAFKWGLIAGAVIVAECIPGQTPTSFAHEFQEPTWGKVVAGVAGYLTLGHLIPEIPLPRGLDPYFMLSDVIDRFKH